jgi:dephospho-CoA kinase
MICFVCGQLCSGKTLYSKTLTHINDSVYVEVGDIVRKIKNSNDRGVLQNSKELHNKIVEEIMRLSIVNGSKQLVISGVRQKEILEIFLDATLLWIECPASIRKQRYLDRKRDGDSQTFEEAEQGDISLGILEVKKFILERP